MSGETCCIKACESVVSKHGMCPKHWYRMKTYGNPMLVTVKQLHGMTIEDRFWARVNKTDSCWLWVGGKVFGRSHEGYGVITSHVVGAKQKNIMAHRFSWEFHNGKIPEGMLVCHKCDNPSCVNPEHLFIGTVQDNNIDKLNKGRHRWGHMKGTEHGMSKLNDEKVRAIRSDSRFDRIIAKEYGVSRVTINDIKNRKIWQHVTSPQEGG